MIPLYGFRQGDTLGLLILAYEHETIAEVARKLQTSARIRVPLQPSYKVIYRGQELSLQDTVKTAGLEALERFDVREGDGDGF